MFNDELMSNCLASCDERIDSLQKKIDNWKPYAGIMGLMAKIYKEEEEQKIFTEAPQMDNVKNLENNIKLVKTEKLIYNAIINKNSTKEIFKLLLAKYDEMLGISYDISGNMVRNGIIVEGEHIDYCKNSLDQREYIRIICCVGYGENSL